MKRPVACCQSLLSRSPALLAVACGALLAAGCGDDSLDATGQAMAETAGRAVAGLEGASSVGWVLSGVDLSAGANRQAIDITTRVLDDVLGSCLQATARPAPALGLTVGFGDGCGIPLTPIQFRGDMALDFAPRGGSSGSALTIAFHKLDLLDTHLDGSLTLTDRAGDFAYEARALRVETGGIDLTLDGKGGMATAGWHTAMVFDGDGSIGSDYGTVGFHAEGLHRGIRDCYPDEGTLTLRITELGITRELTLHFDGDSRDSGKVKADWRGGQHEWYLPARGCTDR